MSDQEDAKLKNADEFTDDAAGWAKRWQAEMTAAKSSLKSWHDDGAKIVDNFLDRRSSKDGADNQGGDTHVNLFSANSQTVRAFLYGKIPQVDVKRRWGDPNDAVARAAGEAYQRLLNTDIERDSDDYTRALKYALSDRLLPGFGLCKLRYVADITSEEVPPKYRTGSNGEAVTDEKGQKIELAPGYTKESKGEEDVKIDYKNWKDVLWSAGARTFEETRWWAFREPMTQDAIKERFGPAFKKAFGDKWESEINSIPLNSTANKNEGNRVMAKPDPWARADVWEIWDREHKKVWWWVDGYPEILDDQDDPLGLEGFWPFPMPMVANLTTDAFIPRPDYVLAQDLYEEVNLVSSRITLLERAILVSGVYDGSLKGVQRLLEEAGQNQLIPIEEWPQFKEKGGLAGAIEWMPLDQIVNALGVLRDYRKELIGLLYQVTGMSDILRGESTAQATATEQAIKAKFASVRLKDFQDEFARFASDIQRLKAEIISKHFDAQTIVERSNVMFTADAQFFTPPQPPPQPMGLQGQPMGPPGQRMMPQPPMGPPPTLDDAPAIKLMRAKFMWYRIQVKPESVSATDYDAMHQERSQAIQTLTQYLTQVFPIGQQAPGMLPYLLEMARWLFTGMRGAQTIEAVFDQAVQKANEMAQQAAEAALQPKPPDPKVVAEQTRADAEKFKAHAEITKTGLQAQVDKAKIGMEMQAAHQKNQHAQIEHEMSMQKTEADMRKEAMKSLADVGSKGKS